MVIQPEADPFRPTHTGFGVGLYAIRSLVDGILSITYLPKEYSLEQNYPNPANPVTWISFSLPAPQEAMVAVYNILGAKVTTLASGLQMPGTHNYIWNASQYSSGVYIIRLETPQNTFSQRVTVVK